MHRYQGKRRKTDAANIEAQFETKITLIKFIRKMWRNGLILEMAQMAPTQQKRNDNVYPANYTREISLNEFGAQFHLSENTYHATLKSIFILLCHSMLIISGWSTPDSYWRNQQLPLQRLRCAADIRMWAILYAASRKCMGYHLLNTEIFKLYLDKVTKEHKVY